MEDSMQMYTDRLETATAAAELILRGEFFEARQRVTVLALAHDVHWRTITTYVVRRLRELARRSAEDASLMNPWGEFWLRLMPYYGVCAAPPEPGIVNKMGMYDQFYARLLVALGVADRDLQHLYRFSWASRRQAAIARFLTGWPEGQHPLEAIAAFECEAVA
ncbi:hypothetical protein JNJ66_04020 [Candidatus Saccharibacteria bacterium]|nr:hypothetical protein [Candidatus Saccharibacteria bacterium]